jgi:hypothetical protein
MSHIDLDIIFYLNGRQPVNTGHTTATTATTCCSGTALCCVGSATTSSTSSNGKGVNSLQVGRLYPGRKSSSSVQVNLHC